MGTQPKVGRKKFRRARRVETLRGEGDPRWTNEAKADLGELLEDDEGIRRLADAIKAMLRQ